MGGGLLLEGSGELDDVSGQTPLARLQHPAFGVGESGERQVGELVQRMLGLSEARLDRARGGAQGRDGGLAGRGDGAVRIAHEGLAGGRVGDRAPGGEKRLGLVDDHQKARNLRPAGTERLRGTVS